MAQRDYIIRLIEQMGAAMVAMRNQILGRKVDPEQTRQEMSSLAGQSGFDLDLLRGFSADSLHMLVAPTGEVEPGRCWLMAEILYLDGLQAEVEERYPEALESLTKARLLYTLVEPGGGLLVGFPEAGDRILEMDARLASFPDAAG